MPRRKSDAQRHLDMMDAVRKDLYKNAERFKERAAEIAEEAQAWDSDKVAAEFTMLSEAMKQFAAFIGMYLGRERFVPSEET